jgi:hypothetical protein
MPVNMLKSDSSAECVCAKLVGKGLLGFGLTDVFVFVHLVTFDVLSEKCCYVWHTVVFYVCNG